MTERLTDTEVAYLLDLIARGFNPLLAPLTAPLQAALTELQARRAADPTEAQRKWYGSVSGWLGRKSECAARLSLLTCSSISPGVAYKFARLAAHFGRLAQGEVKQ